jgi:hypothetical protein
LEGVPEPPPPTPATLAALAALTRVTSLDLSRRPLAAAAAEELVATLPRLRLLSLLGLQMAPEAAARLKAAAPVGVRLALKGGAPDPPLELMPLAGTLCAT